MSRPSCSFGFPIHSNSKLFRARSCSSQRPSSADMPPWGKFHRSLTACLDRAASPPPPSEHLFLGFISWCSGAPDQGFCLICLSSGIITRCEVFDGCWGLYYLRHSPSWGASRGRSREAVVGDRSSLNRCCGSCKVLWVWPPIRILPNSPQLRLLMQRHCLKLKRITRVTL